LPGQEEGKKKERKKKKKPNHLLSSSQSNCLHCNRTWKSVKLRAFSKILEVVVKGNGEVILRSNEDTDYTAGHLVPWRDPGTRIPGGVFLRSEEVSNMISNYFIKGATSRLH
jgi:hypothetical protein